jgi:dihydrofolate reductase
VDVSKEQLHVFGIAALSKDGFIGQDEGHVSTNWTSQEDKDWFWERTKEAGAIVMGSTTFAATRKPNVPLPNRKNYVLTSLAQERQQISQYPLEQLEFINLSPTELIAKAIKDSLRQGFSELAICGGTSVYTQFLPLIDTWYLTWEPKELEEGLRLIRGKGPTDLKAILESEFKLLAKIKMNDQGTFRETWQREKPYAGYY